jgi:hypothetical protein
MDLRMSSGAPFNRDENIANCSTVRRKMKPAPGRDAQFDHGGGDLK